VAHSVLIIALNLATAAHKQEHGQNGDDWQISLPPLWGQAK